MNLRPTTGLLGSTAAVILLGPLAAVPPAQADTLSSAATVASTAHTATERALQRPKASLVVRFAGPADVPAKLRLQRVITGGPGSRFLSLEKRKRKVSRPKAGRRVRLQVPIGTYYLKARPTTVDDQYYAPELRSFITVRRGATAKVTLTMEPGPRGDISLVSAAEDGSLADDYSYSPAISGDGRYVAFSSSASNLVPGDTEDSADVFLRDRELGTTIRVARGGSPSLSDEGRYVAFDSRAGDLVSGDGNGEFDSFVWDRVTGETVRASTAPDGLDPDGPSYSSSISGDGRYVTFLSKAANLVPDDSNGSADVFVWDRVADTTTRINLDADGHEVYGLVESPQISDDGGVVTYVSRAHLAGSPDDRRKDIFVWHRATGTTTWESRTSSGGVPDRRSFSPSLSGDGRFLAFMSASGNMVPGSSGRHFARIYVRDLTTDRLEKVRPFGGYAPSLSQDGRFVLFTSGGGYQSGVGFIHDRTTGETEQVTSTRTGAPMAVEDFSLTFSDDAGVVVALADLDPATPTSLVKRDVLAWVRSD